MANRPEYCQIGISQKDLPTSLDIRLPTCPLCMERWMLQLQVSPPVNAIMLKIFANACSNGKLTTIVPFVRSC